MTKLQTLGLVYLLGVVVDGAASMFATAFQGLENSSDNFSCVMIVFSVAVFVLAVAGRLRPRAVFIVPAVLYAFLAGVGLILGIFVAINMGGQEIPDDFGGHTLRAMFPWYGVVDWILLLMLTGTGAVCAYKYMRSLQDPADTPGLPT
jgi:hypothetical protein